MKNMNPIIKESDLAKRRAHGGLKRALNMNYRVTFEEYEYIARRCHDVVIAHETLALWFKPGWEKELEALRKKQRAKGISDVEFMHCQQKEALYREQQKNGRR